jgi:hypothetical protein
MVIDSPQKRVNSMSPAAAGYRQFARSIVAKSEAG